MATAGDLKDDTFFNAMPACRYGYFYFIVLESLVPE